MAARAEAPTARPKSHMPPAMALRSVILITHATSEYLVREALDAIYADGVIDAPAQVIRIERE